jgi:nucleoside-diphosphate-sugar epimerase
LPAGRELKVKHRSVLITGASGFIGGRLAERLSRQEGLAVTGTGRRFSDVTTLREAGVDIVTGDLRDDAALGRLCAGHEVVFHVAAWMGRDRDERAAHAINVDATRKLAEQAAAAGVRRLVLVSSVAAYGVQAQDSIDETAALDVKQRDPYGRTKALGELAAQEVAARTGLELSIVRPVIVYGPRASAWTVGMVKWVKRGVPVLFGDGSGHCYAVFVDDVVDMLRLCADHPRARGQAFNVSDAPVSWADFFAHYGRMCGRRPRSIPLWLVRALAAGNEGLHLGLPLTPERVRQYTRRLHYPTAKAERLLGWRVSVPLDEGMRRSEKWLRSTGRLPGKSAV